MQFKQLKPFMLILTGLMCMGQSECEPEWDVDGDGYTVSEGDCDDQNSGVYPGGTEFCDELDNDCDGSVDEGVSSTFYLDGDGDGAGDPDSTATACVAPDGYVASGDDCDDEDSGKSPNGEEACDGIDNDCDGAVDEGVSSTFYLDGDGDGAGDPDSTATACFAPDGYVASGDDCDDGDSGKSPDGEEACDGIDNDCDGAVDEGATQVYYYDQDGDGYGIDSATLTLCSEPAGYVTQGGDCSPTDGAIYPGATEACDDVDNDCDGEADEGVTQTYYFDGDGDGFGEAQTSVQACSQPTGYVTGTGDCDDSDDAIFDGAWEDCFDGQDTDCGGVPDEEDPRCDYPNVVLESELGEDLAVVAVDAYTARNFEVDVEDYCESEALHTIVFEWTPADEDFMTEVEFSTEGSTVKNWVDVYAKDNSGRDWDCDLSDSSNTSEIRFLADEWQGAFYIVVVTYGDEGDIHLSARTL